MATQPTDKPISKVVETSLQCCPDDFYKFFKEESNLLPNVCGSVVQKIELADGNKSWLDTVGSRKRIYIVPSPETFENMKYEVIGIDNLAKKITYKVLEGAMLQHYKCLKVTLEVTICSTVKWTIEYEETGEAKRTLDDDEKKGSAKQEPDHDASKEQEPDDVYLKLLSGVNASVNTYLRFGG